MNDALQTAIARDEDIKFVIRQAMIDEPIIIEKARILALDTVEKARILALDTVEKARILALDAVEKAKALALAEVEKIRVNDARFKEIELRLTRLEAKTNAITRSDTFP